MAEYITREAAYEKCGWYNTVNGKSVCAARKDELAAIPAADVAPVVHGRWIEHDESEDGYYHHKCSNCDTDAPFDYKYREDWDEGMDGEWYSLGIIDDGINEHLTAYCPNCGAKMKDGE